MLYILYKLYLKFLVKSEVRFINSFSLLLLSTHYLPGALWGSENRDENNTGKHLVSWSVEFSEGPEKYKEVLWWENQWVS